MLAGSFSPAILMINSVFHIVHFETAGVGASFENWQIMAKHFDSKTGILMIIC